MVSKIIFYKIVMTGVIFSIMTSLIASNGFVTAASNQITGRPQVLVFKIGQFSNTAITYELNLTGIHNPTGAKLVLGGVSENGEVVADLIKPDSSKTKDKEFGTLIRGSITDTSLQGSMKGKSLSDLITAMRDGSTYVNIDTSTNPKGEIRGQIKIPGSASNQIADTNLIAETCNNGTPCDGWDQGTKETIQAEGGKKVGEHSSNPDPTNDDPQNTPREGLGNFAENNTRNKNPSDLGDAVGGSLP